MEAFESRSFPLSSSKSVLGESEGAVWGAWLSSEKRTVSMEPNKLAALAVVTSRLVEGDVASTGLLEKLVGNWGFALSFRRVGLCSLGECYTWCGQEAVSSSAVGRGGG